MDWITSVFLYGVVALLGVLLVFGILVFIHELGHYAAGRYFGLNVEGFSLGLGPPCFPGLIAMERSGPFVCSL